METVTLIYKRLPDRISHFQQRLHYEDENVIITSQRVNPSSPIVHNGETVLGENFTAVWFVFRGQWYDIGKIYNLKNEWTGYYCDIIVPVVRAADRFEITDLYLDLWVYPDGSYEIQDEDEFEAAIQSGAIDTDLARKAREALNALIAEVESGEFPPQIVRTEKGVV